MTEHKARLLKHDGTIQDLPDRPTMKEAQAMVGGWVEMYSTGKVTYFWNEEGRLQNLPVNVTMARLHPEFVPIYGDVVELTGWRTTRP